MHILYQDYPKVRMLAVSSDLDKLLQMMTELDEFHNERIYERMIAGESNLRQAASFTITEVPVLL